jgi:protein associated with RNAse G/E
MGIFMRANVRGIYSTALTKLLLDNGFEMVQPSLTIKKRFGLPDSSAPPDLKIEDRYDLQGIRVLGTSDAVNKFQSALHSTLDDVLTRKWVVSVDGIYKGNLVESDEYTFYVDIGGGVVGRLQKQETADTNEKQVVVQVERKRIGVKQPILTTALKIVGNFAILAQNSEVGVSLRIRELNKRAELYALGEALAPDGWGIIWRQSCVNQSRETLENEIKALAEKVENLNEKALHAEAPTLLIEGSCFMDVEFPWFSKRNLDKLRASAAPTLDGHHFYKSCGGEVSAALEMAEKLLEEGQNRSDVEEAFKKQILYEFPEAGSTVDIEHVKLSGVVFHLGEATIESLADEQIKYERTMQSNGFYDGLGTKKETGDRAVSETRAGEWCITTRYFSKDGESKGTYVNLNTPVEVYPKAVRYVDLEVDVCIQPDGAIRVLDVEKLEKALEKGFISKKLFEIVKEKAKEISAVNAI